MRIFIRLSALLALFVAAPAMAQGTSAQREACEDDAKRFCQAQIPDVVAIESCLRGNAAAIDAACRVELGLPQTSDAAPSGSKKRRH
jgi:hypothetical protein